MWAKKRKKICGSGKVRFNIDTVLFVILLSYSFVDRFEFTKFKL